MKFKIKTPLAVAVCGWVSFLSLLPGRATAEEDKAKQVVECLRTEYGDLPGFRVDYERTIQTSSMVMLGGSGTGDHARGEIFFMPPHYLKIHQKEPREEIVTTNNEYLWWYIPDEKKVHRYRVEEVGKELRALAEVFQGLKEVEESFVISWEGHTEAGDRKIQLVPNPPWAQTDHLTLTVTQGCRLRVVEITSVVGDVTRFVLEGLQPMESLEEDFFRFEVPDGVRVINETP